MERQNQTNSKLKIFISLILLVIIFCIIYNYRVQQSNLDVTSYLKNKYHQDFEIIKEDSRQYEIGGLYIDGATFFPSIKMKDKYEYFYEILSVSDNIKFQVYQFSNKGKNRFKDSYIILKNIDDILNKTSNYIVDFIGNSDTTSKTSFEKRKL